MSTAEQIVNAVVAWAARDANVRRLVLVGSRASLEPPDELADIDLQAYVKTAECYLQDYAWLQQIAQPWLCVRDEYFDDDVTVPTLLVIFENGVKVDFAFYPQAVLSGGIRAGLAHRMLFEKEAVARNGREILVPAWTLAPEEPEFRRVIEEFWFEMYHVAKYLVRGELWLAKSRDWATKQLLIRMIHWHEKFVSGVQDGWYEGRRDAMSDDTWEALHDTFSGFARDESWHAALATISLFRRLSGGVAATLGFAYPIDLDRNLSGFILEQLKGE